jgi:hypothetical protein
MMANRELIIALTARYGVPAIYYNRFFSEPGGLISFGEARDEQFRLAAGYIDRILKGEKPADLPLQAPTKFELIINLKTAKALGLQRAGAIRSWRVLVNSPTCRSRTDSAKSVEGRRCSKLRTGSKSSVSGNTLSALPRMTLISIF